MYTLERYLAVKETEIMTFSGKWMELESITMEKEDLFLQCSGLSM